MSDTTTPITKAQSARGKGTKPKATRPTINGKPMREKETTPLVPRRNPAAAKGTKTAKAAKTAKPKVVTPKAPEREVPPLSEKQAQALVDEGYSLEGKRQDGGTFLVKGATRVEFPRPVKALKRKVMVMITERDKALKAAMDAELKALADADAEKGKKADA